MIRHAYIVDDDEAVRTSLRMLLRTQPDTFVNVYKSGDAFLPITGSLEPGLALIDVHMPGSSGLDVLNELSKDRSPIMTIMVTGQGNISMAVDAMKSGALDFIEKPYDRTMLLNLVENSFRRLEQSDEAEHRRQSARSKIGRLSGREKDVLNCLIAGRANKMIAYELDISARTVEIYRANLMTKLGIKSVSEAVRIAFAAGLIDA